MSCSDKILKWNVLGVQGALLSNLVEPIKLASITFRKNGPVTFGNPSIVLLLLVSGFKQSHTSRAICCRLEKATDPVQVHHPMIGEMSTTGGALQQSTFSLSILGRVKYPLVPPRDFESDYSYAWSTSFQGETIDARSGRPVTG